jgi:hypothetical protein
MPHSVEMVSPRQSDGPDIKDIPCDITSTVYLYRWYMGYDGPACLRQCFAVFRYHVIPICNELGLYEHPPETVHSAVHGKRIGLRLSGFNKNLSESLYYDMDSRHHLGNSKQTHWYCIGANHVTMEHLNGTIPQVEFGHIPLVSFLVDQS